VVSGASELLGRLVELGSSDDDGPPAGDVISRNTVLAAWSKSAGVRPGESPSAGGGRSTEEEGRRRGIRRARGATTLVEIEGRYLQSVESKTHGRSLAVKPDVISYNTNHRRIRECREDGTPTARKAEKRYSPE
jgi:hypothetical protein